MMTKILKETKEFFRDFFKEKHWWEKTPAEIKNDILFVDIIVYGGTLFVFILLILGAFFK